MTSAPTTLYELLSSARRRAVMAELAEEDRPLSKRELATRLGSGEGRSASDDDLSDLTTELHHVHFPKLEAAGVVTDAPSEGYALTRFGRDVERAARAFEAVVGGTPRGRSDPAVSLSVSPDALDAVERLRTADERFETDDRYSEVVDAVAREVAETDGGE
jgi:hypothetical protein